MVLLDGDPRMMLLREPSFHAKGLEAVEKEPMPIVRVRIERAVHLDV